MRAKKARLEEWVLLTYWNWKEVVKDKSSSASFRLVGYYKNTVEAHSTARKKRLGDFLGLYFICPSVGSGRGYSFSVVTIVIKHGNKTIGRLVTSDRIRLNLQKGKVRK